ncbi:MAG TPA: ATP-grasp domain-containing protein [Flavobacteriales bacterium]|nr:ATP-grasp domain-containing protein [Flavobacteriales bacterium]HNI05485.1 ATP-grasp domain-containing protein [Flavobacteriales bacterium]HNK39896.1 ATP-grasp domain-containing protein [Flavobacteriales bacterium]HNK68945.1 ATP-grasp domain-containing protein [Flavobacteriales bacterium]HNM69860.1 ATP-grasp domain-containing protein [Flavobacteriales bacterium]
MGQIRVLVFPCGAENALEIHAALKDVMNVDLYGASSRDDHGSYVFRRCDTGLPDFRDADFLPRFTAMLERDAIDVIMPTHDDLALHLARHQPLWKARVAVPGQEQARIARSKRATYALFADTGFTPKLYTDAAQVDRYPVFVKPDEGQGGKGAGTVRDSAELMGLGDLSHLVVTEVLPGEELTVDCFSDRHGALRFTGPRTRARIFGGISVRTATAELTPEIDGIARTIHERMRMRGLWYFQLKRDAAGAWKLLEVSVRTAGSMGLYRALGINLPLLTVYDLLDLDVSITRNAGDMEMDRALANSFRSDLSYDIAYVDYDETLIKDGHVNWSAMLFVYNARARGKRLRLITKHAGDLRESLQEHAIHEGLFEEIVHLRPDERKSDHIRDAARAIFIDNAFKERAEVQRVHRMPVFDVDAIPALIDQRE